MPELILLAAVLYVAASIYQPMKPFKSRREAVMYGVPGVIVVAVLLSMLPPPDENGEANFGQQQQQQPQQQLTRDQEQMRLNKLRGRDEGTLDAQLRDAARQPQAPGQKP